MMGIIDFLQNNNPFLSSREGDFIPLDQESNTEKPYLGPPLIILYAVPKSLDMEELSDMVCDGMPNRKVVNFISTDENNHGGDYDDDVVMIRRLEGMDENGAGGDELLDLSVEDALNTLVATAAATSPPPTTTTTPSTMGVTSSSSSSTASSVGSSRCCPVLYFSGVSNKEMMDTYRIIANEIYTETNGVYWPACAKLVPPAMNKSMRQVLSEISGDHAEAMKQQGTTEEETQ
ncbi:hypothetical protein ACHAXM_002011 [Skeletonema potamos]|jgi:hypothetical protein